MGWMSFRLKEPVKEWFVKNIDENYTVLDVAIVHRNELYAAVKEKKSGNVYAIVYMLQWSRDYYNFSYKSMPEFAGPVISNCPERILKLLTDLDENDTKNEFAIDWRKRCWKNIESRKNKNVILKTEVPIKFSNGCEYEYFKRDGRKLFAGYFDNNVFVPHVKVRLNISKYNYDLIYL